MLPPSANDFGRDIRTDAQVTAIEAGLQLAAQTGLPHHPEILKFVMPDSF